MKFLESIKVKNGQVENIKFHNIRFNQTRQAFFDAREEVNLEDFVQVPESPEQGFYKCRIVYGRKIETIEFFSYQIPTIKSLKVVHTESLDYSFKYADRAALDQLFSQRGDADDILIIRNGLLTDSYYCNVLLYDGEAWLTPEKPLLAGTQRAKLLENNMIYTANIAVEDLPSFQDIKLINAMLDFEDAPRGLKVE